MGEEEIVNLEITMSNVLAVKVLQSIHQAGKVLFGFLIIVGSFQLLTKVTLDRAIGGKLHDNVAVRGRLENFRRQDDVHVFDISRDEHFTFEATLHPGSHIRNGQLKDFDGYLSVRCLAFLIGLSILHSTAVHSTEKANKLTFRICEALKKWVWHLLGKGAFPDKVFLLGLVAALAEKLKRVLACG